MDHDEQRDYAEEDYNRRLMTICPDCERGDCQGCPACDEACIADCECDGNACQGHESLDGAHMGETVYCDGTCA